MYQTSNFHSDGGSLKNCIASHWHYWIPREQTFIISVLIEETHEHFYSLCKFCIIQKAVHHWDLWPGCPPYLQVLFYSLCSRHFFCTNEASGCQDPLLACSACFAPTQPWLKPACLTAHSVHKGYLFVSTGKHLIKLIAGLVYFWQWIPGTFCR